MFEAFVAYSDDIDTEDAIAEVLAGCKSALQGKVPSAALLFCGTEYDHHLILQRINELFPGVALIGCTTDGEMSSCGGFTEDAIILMMLCADRIGIGAGVGQHAGASPQAAAEEAVELASQALDDPPCLAVVLPDGLSSNAFQVLEGFSQALGDGVPVVGGMSADRVAGNKDIYTTYQFYRDQVLTDSVPVLLFSGPLTYSLGVESGWSPIGRKVTVTKAKDNVIYTLDSKPAFELYLHYLGDVMKENIAGIGSYPLAVYEPGLDRYYLRVAKAADPETGTITFLGEVPEGAQVQITQAIRDEVMAGVNKSVESALSHFRGGRPSLGMMFSCTGRKIALGTKTRDEIACVQGGLLPEIPLIGFYTFGEIGPVADHTRARYHNTTFVTLLLGEED